MATRLVSLLAAVGLGLVAVGSAAAQGVPAHAPPVLVPASLVDGVGELLRVFEEGKDAAEKVDPPEVSLGTAFEPQAEYR